MVELCLVKSGYGRMILLSCAIMARIIRLGKATVHFIEQSRLPSTDTAIAVVALFLLAGLIQWLLLAYATDMGGVIGNALLFFLVMAAALPVLLILGHTERRADEAERKADAREEKAAERHAELLTAVNRIADILQANAAGTTPRP